MAGFVKGDVVVIPFPFSDLKGVKKRPALVIASPKGFDLILCQITSQINKDVYSISLDSIDFDTGSLPKLSYIRPNKLFTADSRIICKKTGTLKHQKTMEVIDTLIKIIK